MTIKRIDFAPNDVLSAANLEQVQDNGAIQVTSVSELSSLPSTIKVAHVSDTGLMYSYNGSSWIPVVTNTSIDGLMVSGFYSIDTIGAVAAGSRYTFKISWPAGFNETNCLIFVNWQQGSTPTSGYSASTAAGMKVVVSTHLHSSDGFNVTLYFPETYTVDNRAGYDGVRWMCMKSSDIS